MVGCELCGGEFGSITYSHLKNKHEIATKEYRVQFPEAEMASEECRRKNSLNRKKYFEIPANRENMSRQTSRFFKEHPESHPMKNPITVKKAALKRRGHKYNGKECPKCGKFHRDFTGEQNVSNRADVKKIIGKKSSEKWDDPMYREKHSGENSFTKRPEVREKISKGRKKFCKEHPEKHPMNNPVFRKKVALKNKKRWEDSDSEYKDRVIRATMLGNRIKPNKLEKKINLLLQENFPNQFKFVGDGKVVMNGRCPDFIDCNGQKKVILANGNYWHLDRLKKERLGLTKEMVEKEEIVSYEEFGFKVLHIWEDELKDEKQVVEKIREFSLGEKFL